MKLLLATKNTDKINEIKKILSDLTVEILTFKDFDFLPEVIEDKESIKENAIKKATEITNITGLPSLADDTGLFVNYLDGKPGVYSSRFAGENVSYKENRKKLLKELCNVEIKKRKAYFKTIVAFAGQNKEIFTTSGKCNGLIIDKEKGTNGFGYDSIFLPEGRNKTFAEMDESEKNKISHRAIALNKIKKILIEHILEIY